MPDDEPGRPAWPLSPWLWLSIQDDIARLRADLRRERQEREVRAAEGTKRRPAQRWLPWAVGGLAAAALAGLALWLFRALRR